MSKTTKLTVKTDVGTFTRTTVRTYTHLVAVSGERAEVLEERRQRELATKRAECARYAETIRTGVGAQGDGRYTQEWLADGSYQRWVDDLTAAIAALDAIPTITQDEQNWGVLGWCGRLDLAQKLAGTEAADRFRHVHIYSIDGSRVSASTHPVTDTKAVAMQRDYRRRR